MKEIKITERMLPIWANYLLYALLGLGVYCAVAYKMTEIECIFLFAFGILILCFSMRLDIILTANEIKYKLVPWHSQFTIIEKSKITQLSVRSVHAFKEFGGIGIRYNKGYTAYVLGGNEGIDVHFLNKKIILCISDVEKVKDFLKENGFLK
jgi:hypothetical protein